MPLTPFAIRELELHSPVALTLADRRLYNYLLHHAIDRIQDRLEFSIEVENLHGVFGVGAAPAERLKESLRRLLNTEIEFLLQEKNKQFWHVMTLLADATLDMMRNQLIYCYSSKCRLLFTNPFLLERCLIQAHFTYKYSTLIYELLAEEFYQGYADFYVEVETLRSRLRVEPNKMTNFSDFKRFVLEPALKEINTYAGFIVQYAPVNRGRKIIGLNFLCKSKSTLGIPSAKEVIPPRRPRFFVESPTEEYAYAYLLNADITMRQRYFKLARQRAVSAGLSLTEHDIDQPDLWYRLILADLIKQLDVK